jgi:glycosyltransferase involved in cell wall biosynthesis
MRVGMDVSQAVYGTGVGDYTVDLYRALRKISPTDEIIPIGFSLRRQKDLQRIFPGIRTYPIPPTALHYLWNIAHQLPAELFTGKIDVFHASDWTQPPSRAKKVTTIHDLSPFLFPAETINPILAVHRAKMHWVVREADAVICVSRNTAADAQSLFKIPVSKITVIPEALPTRFLLTPKPVTEKNFLLAIGARQPRKNITRLISAYHHFKTRFRLPEKLVIIGENQTASAWPDVLFTGSVSDQQLVNYLAAAAVFVYPSLYEGFGLPVLIAFYHHVPVACSNTSSLPEVAGSAAELFDPTDEEAIAAAILKALKNRHQLVTAGSKQLSKFSWTSAAQPTLTVYKSLC